MGIDWEGKVGAPNVAVFGEPATFTPKSGAGAYSITGVFDNQFRATTIEDANAPHTSDLLPVFGVNRSQFQAEPVQGDKVTFPATALGDHANNTYIIIEPRPDNHGIYHLALNLAAGPP